MWGEPAGRLSIIGTGPGDPDLLTVKALRLLEQAQVVAYDATVAAPILALRDPAAVLIAVDSRVQGEADGCCDAIELMSLHARGGHRVVRLCGGDAWIFGPGPSESMLLQDRGVQVDIVPGVSLSLAIPELAGIPYAEGSKAGFAVVSADALAGEWTLAAAFPEMVIWCGRQPVAEVARRLLLAGRAACDPVAVMPANCCGAARCLIFTLQELALEQTPWPDQTVCVVGESVIRKSSLGEPPAWSTAGQWSSR